MVTCKRPMRKYVINSTANSGKPGLSGLPTRGQKISVFQYVSPLIETLRKVYASRELEFDIHLQPDAVFSPATAMT